MTASFVVDLDAFAQNLRTIRERIAPAEHMLVVKDDAYAHGLEAIVTRAAAEGIRWIGALDVATGCQVRDLLGGDVRIFAWMLVGPSDIAEAIAADLDCGVGNAELLEEVAAAATNRTARVHLKIDTGLHRNGIRPEDWQTVVARAQVLEAEGRIRVAGIWSHIAEASDEEDDLSRDIFDAAVMQARAAGLEPETLHLAASAAAFARNEFRYSMARIGAFAYGIRSTDGPSDADLGIVPIGTLMAEVASTSQPDDDEPSTATVDVGIDALSSLYAGNVSIAHSGERFALTFVGQQESQLSPSSAAVGEQIALFGGSAAESATDIAERIGTIGEEVVLRISPLVPRVYLS